MAVGRPSSSWAAAGGPASSWAAAGGRPASYQEEEEDQRHLGPRQEEDQLHLGPGQEEEGQLCIGQQQKDHLNLGKQQEGKLILKCLKELNTDKTWILLLHSWAAAGGPFPSWAAAGGPSPSWAAAGGPSPSWAAAGGPSPSWAAAGRPSLSWGQQKDHLCLAQHSRRPWEENQLGRQQQEEAQFHLGRQQQEGHLHLGKEQEVHLHLGQQKEGHLNLGQQQDDHRCLGQHEEEDGELRLGSSRRGSSKMAGFAVGRSCSSYILGGSSINYCTVNILNIFCANKCHSPVKISLKGGTKGAGGGGRRRLRGGAKLQLLIRAQ